MGEKFDSTKNFYKEETENNINFFKNRIKEIDAELETASEHKRDLLEIEKKTLEEGIKNNIEEGKKRAEKFVGPTIKGLN